MKESNVFPRVLEILCAVAIVLTLTKLICRGEDAPKTATTDSAAPTLHIPQAGGSILVTAALPHLVNINWAGKPVLSIQGILTDTPKVAWTVRVPTEPQEVSVRLITLDGKKWKAQWVEDK
jgi:hypothetical protein